MHTNLPHHLLDNLCKIALYIARRATLPLAMLLALTFAVPVQAFTLEMMKVAQKCEEEFDFFHYKEHLNGALNAPLIEGSELSQCLKSARTKLAKSRGEDWQKIEPELKAAEDEFFVLLEKIHCKDYHQCREEEKGIYSFEDYINYLKFLLYMLEIEPYPESFIEQIPRVNAEMIKRATEAKEKRDKEAAEEARLLAEADKRIAERKAKYPYTTETFDICVDRRYDYKIPREAIGQDIKVYQEREEEYIKCLKDRLQALTEKQYSKEKWEKISPLIDKIQSPYRDLFCTINCPNYPIYWDFHELRTYNNYAQFLGELLSRIERPRTPAEIAKEMKLAKDMKKEAANKAPQEDSSAKSKVDIIKEVAAKCDKQKDKNKDAEPFDKCFIAGMQDYVLKHLGEPHQQAITKDFAAINPLYKSLYEQIECKNPAACTTDEDLFVKVDYEVMMLEFFSQLVDEFN